MDRTTYALLTFANSHLVLKAEKTLENEDIKVVPLPSEISKGCGISIMCEINNLENIVNILNKNKLIFMKAYQITKNGLSKTIEELTEF